MIRDQKGTTSLIMQKREQPKGRNCMPAAKPATFYPEREMGRLRMTSADWTCYSVCLHKQETRGQRQALRW